jgi:pyruvate formate lyase activating enzyme
MRGIVFNIQPYSLHDGPGIRTIVFLKGCYLRCKWCSNPESQEFYPQVYLDGKKCINDVGCSFCCEVCPKNAIEGNTLNHNLCNNCTECVSLCPSKALNIYGKEMSVNEVLDEVEKESSFYQRGNGGLTLSGGEPFAQGEFAIEILREAQKRHIHTAVETCGYCDTDVLKNGAKYLDYIMFDIKCMDSHKHKKYTCQGNELILENLKMLFDEFPKLHKHIRTPVIPTFNDNENDIKEILNFLKGKENYSYELLPYHRFGQDKYNYLGRSYPEFPEKLDMELFKNLKKLL